MTVKKRKRAVFYGVVVRQTLHALWEVAPILPTPLRLWLCLCLIVKVVLLEASAAWSTATTPEPINANAATIAKTAIVLLMSVFGYYTAIILRLRKSLLKS